MSCASVARDSAACRRFSSLVSCAWSAAAAAAAYLAARFCCLSPPTIDGRRISSASASVSCEASAGAFLCRASACTCSCVWRTSVRAPLSSLLRLQLRVELRRVSHCRLKQLLLLAQVRLELSRLRFCSVLTVHCLVPLSGGAGSCCQACADLRATELEFEHSGKQEHAHVLVQKGGKNAAGPNKIP